MPKTNMIRPDGTVVGVDTSKVEEYTSLGYRPETPQEVVERGHQAAEEAYYSSGAQGVGAFTEGFLAGGTLGLSDLLLEDEGTRKRAKYNQGKRVAGEVLGAVVTSVVPGGQFTPTGALSRGTQALARGRGAVAKIAAAGAEGAVAGVGSELSRTTLSGDPLTVEGALASGGLGLLLGSGAGALGVGFEAAASRFAPEATKTVEQQLLERATGTPGRTFDYSQPLYQKADESLGYALPNANTAVEARQLAAEAMISPEKWGQFRTSVKEMRDSSSRLINQVDEAHNMAKLAAKRAEEAIPGVPSLTALPEEEITRGAAEFAPPPDLTQRAFDPLNLFDAPKQVPESAFAPPVSAAPDYRAHLQEVGDIGTGVYSEAVTGGKASKAQIGRLRATWRHAKEALASKNPTKIEAAIEKYKAAIKELSGDVEFPALQKTAGEIPSAKPGTRDPGVISGLGKEMEARAFDEGLEPYTPPGGGDITPGLGAQLAADEARLGAGVDASLASARAQQAAKSVEDVMRFEQAVKQIRLPENPQEFFLMGGEPAESIFAAFDAALKSGVPEAKPLQASLTQLIDDLSLSAGIDVPAGNAVSRLRAVHAAGKQNMRNASAAWEQKVWGPEAEKISVPGLAEDIEEANKRALTEGHLITPKKAAQAEKEAAQSKGGLLTRFARNLQRVAAFAALGGTGSVASAARAAVVSEVLSLKTRTLGILKGVAQRGKGAAKVTRLAGPRLEPLHNSLSGLHDPHEDLKSAFAARSRELREAMVSAKDRAFLAAQGLTAAGHPEFAKAAYDQTSRVIEALSSRLPRLPQGVSWGEESVFDWPAEQIEVYSQVWNAGTQPMDFLEFASEDPQSVFPDAMRTLEEAWPGLYAEWRSEALMSLDMDNMTMEELDGWSTLLNVPLIPTHRPEFIAAQAMMFLENQAPAQPSQPTTKPSGQAGRPAMNNQDATPAQRQMMR